MKTPHMLFTALTLAAACASACAAENWKPLWNGKTLDGWHVIGKGEWKIIDGAIRGAHAKEEKEFGHLVSAPLPGFTPEIQGGGGNGLYFRIEEDSVASPASRPKSIGEDAGGLYETMAARGRQSAGRERWFAGAGTMTVSARRPHRRVSTAHERRVER